MNNDTRTITAINLHERLRRAERVGLFLDYDGTLADLAPTPAHVEPLSDVVEVVERLKQHPRIRVAIISGRRLDHVRQLIPVSGILMAGTYGVELQTPEGEQVNQVDYHQVRPVLEELKPKLQALIAHDEGFFLEDKGWALAIHGRRADPEAVPDVMEAARQLYDQSVKEGPLQVIDGYKFLEIGPQAADKGLTIEYLLHKYPYDGAVLIYLGDDDKDEPAFQAVKRAGGYAILVALEERATAADFRLRSPEEARHWLTSLPEFLLPG